MRVLDAISLTDTQKRVLAIIASAATPKTAAESISGDISLSTATKILKDLGLVIIRPTGAELTDKGVQVATEENIMDTSGQLTQDGEQLVGASDQPSADSIASSPEEVMDIPPEQLTMSHAENIGNLKLLRELMSL